MAWCSAAMGRCHARRHPSRQRRRIDSHRARESRPTFGPGLARRAPSPPPRTQSSICMSHHGPTHERQLQVETSGVVRRQVIHRLAGSRRDRRSMRRGGFGRERCRHLCSAHRPSRGFAGTATGPTTEFGSIREAPRTLSIPPRTIGSTPASTSRVVSLRRCCQLGRLDRSRRFADRPASAVALFTRFSAPALRDSAMRRAACSS